MHFEIIGNITNRQVIAVGDAIRELPRLQKVYGDGQWRKVKGAAQIRLPGNIIRTAEIHWYEAHGIGKREFKIKRFVK